MYFYNNLSGFVFHLYLRRWVWLVVQRSPFIVRLSLSNDQEDNDGNDDDGKSETNSDSDSEGDLTLVVVGLLNGVSRGRSSGRKRIIDGLGVNGDGIKRSMLMGEEIVSIGGIGVTEDQFSGVFLGHRKVSNGNDDGGLVGANGHH